MGTPLFFSTHQAKERMRKFSTLNKSFDSVEEWRAYLNLRFQKDLEKKSTKPLSPEATTDALKMKELTERFRFADFHVTDPTKGLYYKVEFDEDGIDKCPTIYYYDDDGRSYPCSCFPRPFKIEVTTGTAHNIKKDLTHFFD